MERRDFLKKAGVGAAAAVAATAVNAPAVLGQKKYRWKMVTILTIRALTDARKMALPKRNAKK